MDRTIGFAMKLEPDRQRFDVWIAVKKQGSRGTNVENRWLLLLDHKSSVNQIKIERV